MLISKEKFELLPAEDLRGLGNYATVDKPKDELGDNVAIVSIGMAAEGKLAAALINPSGGEPAPMVDKEVF